MPGVVGVVEWLELAPDGIPVASGRAANLFLDQGRSAFGAWARGLLTGGLRPHWMHFGTGTAQPAITQTALQYPVSAKSASATTVENNFTSRVSLTLQATEVTGLIRELLLADGPTAAYMAYARALFSAQHLSGNTLVVHWRQAMLA